MGGGGDLCVACWVLYDGGQGGTDLVCLQSTSLLFFFYFFLIPLRHFRGFPTHCKMMRPVYQCTISDVKGKEYELVRESNGVLYALSVLEPTAAGLRSFFSREQIPIFLVK